MSTILFDAPGPRARRRHLVATVISAALALTLLGLIIYKLYLEGEFEAELWEELSQPNIWNAIGDGILATLSAAAAAIVLAVLFGAVCALARQSSRAWVRWPFGVIVEFFRAVPVILLMLFFFYGFDLSPYLSVVLGLTFYNGSVLAEVFRAGLLSVPRGQSEAAYSLGMRKGQVLGSVLFPQAVRIMFPTIISQCVVVLKDTALGGLVTYNQELLTQGKRIADFVGYTVVPLLLVAVIYIAMNYALSRLAVWVERRMSRSRSGTADPEQVQVAGMNAGA